mmetsp:Transcript_29999/g.78561  ORF Transcript_29999/g.78561 Transcript_29999/m.78561 type:complete len:263 (+) Transcript_29999:306-1094(+)
MRLPTLDRLQYPRLHVPVEALLQRLVTSVLPPQVVRPAAENLAARRLPEELLGELRVHLHAQRLGALGHVAVHVVVQARELLLHERVDPRVERHRALDVIPVHHEALDGDRRPGPCPRGGPRHGHRTAGRPQRARGGAGSHAFRGDGGGRGGAGTLADPRGGAAVAAGHLPRLRPGRRRRRCGGAAAASSACAARTGHGSPLRRLLLRAATGPPGGLLAQRHGFGGALVVEDLPRPGGNLEAGVAAQHVPQELLLLGLQLEG